MNNKYNLDLVRIVEQLKAKRIIKKDIEIAEKTGYSRAVVSNYLSGRVKASDKFLNKFYEVYEITNPENIVLKTKSEAKQVEFDDFMEVGYLSVRGYAGYLNGFADNMLNESDLQTMLVPREFEKGNYLVIEVNGHSMDDDSKRAICDGDKLLCKELDRSYWINSKLYFKDYLFAVVTKEDGIVIKEITEHDLIGGFIICHSWNPMYQDFKVNVEDIYQLFYVKKIVERKINV